MTVARALLWALTLLLALPCANGARAQTADIILPEESETLRAVRARNVSVRQRQRPGYDPVPIRLGPWAVLPAVAVETRYDSNIFAQRENVVDDVLVRIMPRVRADTELRAARLQVAADVDSRQFVGRRSESTTDFGIRGLAQFDIRRATAVAVRLGYGLRTEPRTDPDTLTAAARPIRFGAIDAAVEASHIFNRVRVAGRVGFETRDFRDSPAVGGGIIDQDFRDREVVSGELSTEYGVTPDIALFVTAAANRRHYPRLGPQGIPRDSTGRAASAGAAFELGAKARGEMSLGYLTQDYDSAEFGTVGGVLVRGRVEWFATPLVTVTVAAERTVEEAANNRTGGYLATRTSVRADYELLRNLILTARAEYENNDFNAIDRTLDRFEGSFGGEYLINPRFALRASYQHQTRRSDGGFPGREFDLDRVTLGIVARGL